MNSVVIDSVHKIFRPAGFFGFGAGRAETYALKGISLSAAAGEVLALARSKRERKKHDPEAGLDHAACQIVAACSVGGADTRAHSRGVRKQVGFALASERSFFPRLTVRENLDFFAALEDLPRRERAHRVESVLHEVGLQEAGGKQAMKLSSGMYQRLGIARALIKRPSVLLLDEPTRSLDPAAASHLWRLIRELADATASPFFLPRTISLRRSRWLTASQFCKRVNCWRVERARGFSVERLRDFYLELTGEREPIEWPEGMPA